MKNLQPLHSHSTVMESKKCSQIASLKYFKFHKEKGKFSVFIFCLLPLIHPTPWKKREKALLPFLLSTYFYSIWSKEELNKIFKGKTKYLGKVYLGDLKLEAPGELRIRIMIKYVTNTLKIYKYYFLFFVVLHLYPLWFSKIGTIFFIY